MLEALKKAIETDGVGIGNDVVKVDSFLNHRIDVKLMDEMGQAIYDAFRDEPIDLIMTVEASGIGVATAVSRAFGYVPVVFAKKSSHINVGNDVYTAEVYSFTHQKMTCIRVSRKYLRAGMRVLLVDDFLANGAALKGMMSVLQQAGCECVGAGICVEKGFQRGGDEMRARGLKIVSLAVVDAIQDGKIILRDN